MIGRHAIALCNRRRGPAFLAMAFIALAAPKFGHASEPDPAGVLGLWMTEKNTAAIEIYPCEENLCGKIVWLARPYKRDGKNVKRDDRNPNPALRDRPYCGIETIWGLKAKREGVWTRGRLYYPKKGTTYDVDIKLKDDDRLELRAYLGVRLFGKTETWFRPEPDRTLACVPVPES